MTCIVQIDVARWSPDDRRCTTELWRELMQRPDPDLAAAARAALEADPPFRVCLHVMTLFPEYLTTPADELLGSFLTDRAAAVDRAVLAQLGAVFVELWCKRPRNRFWYGDLRQSLFPYALQERIALVPAVQAQLLDDFRRLAPLERVKPTDLGCRRLERAAELLLHAPADECRATLLPIVQLDRVDRQHTRAPSRYEGVYWGMVRILRKIGEDL